MGTEIKFNTVASYGQFSPAKGACHGRVIHNDSLSIDGIAREFTEFAKLDEHAARMYASYFIDYIVKAVGEGKRLNFGAFSLYLTMKGSIDGANGSFDPAKNSMELNIRVYEPLKRALEQLQPVNATGEGEGMRITSVMDGILKEEGTLKLGAMGYAAGSGFLIDTSRDDEGVWLESVGDGNKVLRARVETSSMTTLDFMFEGTVAPGTYRLAVYSRIGDPSRPTPTVTRRKISVVA